VVARRPDEGRRRLPKPTNRLRQRLAQLVVATVLAFDGIGAERHQAMGACARDGDQRAQGVDAGAGISIGPQ